MKSKLSKILLFALLAVLLFGSINVAAYESYDTYTYSIDGEPLKSPAAYTPDFTTYDSGSMGLLGGNHWAYGEDNELGIWKGTAMKPIAYGESFSSDNLLYQLNPDGESYSVVGLTSSYLQKYALEYKKLTDTIDSTLTKYKVPEGDAVAYEYVIFAPDSIEAPEGELLTADNFIDSFIVAIDNAVAATKQAKGEDAIVVFEIDATAVKKLFLSKLESKNIEIPEFYNKLPVTAVADGAFTAEKDTDREDNDEDVAAVYSATTAILIGSNVTNVAKNAFGDCSLSAVFYAGESATAWNVNNNNAFSRATVYYYSEGIRFGNLSLQLASDMVADKDGNLYVVDKANNRIVVLNKRDFKVIGVMGEYVDEYGKAQSLKSPSGVYVTNPDKMVNADTAEIYVCDTLNKRIVVFNDKYEYSRTIEEPESALLDDDDFELNAIAVDIYGRIFAVSHNCHEGVMVMSKEGNFTGFIGAQKVTVDPIQQLWNKYFKTAEQRLEEQKELPVPFNNITVDDNGFVYVTINFTEPGDLKNQLASITEKESGFSPVKKLNSTGVEIMKRNGFFDPGGEVVLSTAGATPEDLSKIIDVAIGNEGSWSLLDNKRSRVFTYDSNGNLLFAFGDKGDQVGNGENYVAMTYQIIDGVYNLVLLDNTATGYKIIVYHPTEYCDTIMSALRNENIHNHSATIDDWREVLTRNNNFDLAYIGIGKALYHLGDYDGAMEMLSSAYETDYYAKAFAEKRKQILGKWMIPIIIGVIAILVLFFKFLGWAKKKNKATALKVGKKTFGEELIYICHLVFHPFDGFWDLKHEKRGSVRAATTILAVTIFAFFYQAIGQGYMFNPRGDYSTVFLQVIAVLVPVLLWVVANWCLTTLFDGEGSLKDIYIATCYSLAPLPLFVTLSTILSNVFTTAEGSMVTLLVTIGYIWVGLLLFFGMSVTHDYSLGKNFITVLGTIVAMVVIMFIAILFSSLVIKMITFIIAIVSEIFGRF